jgi:hypothetical protein
VEAGKPDRTDSPFTANLVSISAQLIFGASLVKFPGSLEISSGHGMVARWFARQAVHRAPSQ